MRYSLLVLTRTLVRTEAAHIHVQYLGSFGRSDSFGAVCCLLLLSWSLSSKSVLGFACCCLLGHVFAPRSTELILNLNSSWLYCLLLLSFACFGLLWLVLACFGCFGCLRFPFHCYSGFALCWFIFRIFSLLWLIFSIF